MSRTYWLSFCGPDEPNRDSLLGVCVVDVDDHDAATVNRLYPWVGDAWFVAAVRKSHMLKCNPGGQCMGMEVDPDIPAMRGVLMSRAESEAIGGVSCAEFAGDERGH